jgi:CRISPR/Cas system CMR subunit Cmr6 (Cas7 group RAMP superfamily)
MNFNLIALIVLLISLAGLSVIVVRRIPELKKSPEGEIRLFKKETRKKIREKTREIFKNNSSSIEDVLHKLLSKIRILSLKTDKRVSGWLATLRKRSVDRKFGLDNYWKDIKTSMGKKN